MKRFIMITAIVAAIVMCMSACTNTGFVGNTTRTRTRTTQPSTTTRRHTPRNDDRMHTAPSPSVHRGTLPGTTRDNANPGMHRDNMPHTHRGNMPHTNRGSMPHTGYGNVPPAANSPHNPHAVPNSPAVAPHMTTSPMTQGNTGGNTAR